MCIHIDQWNVSVCAQICCVKVIPMILSKSKSQIIYRHNSGKCNRPKLFLFPRSPILIILEGCHNKIKNYYTLSSTPLTLKVLVMTVDALGHLLTG